jgi:hypothetical protein
VVGLRLDGFAAPLQLQRQLWLLAARPDLAH